ncbi:MAG: hypothetical protein P8X82_02510 [Gemmatimonadales bacterium]
MPPVRFEDLPPNARLWTFAASRPVTDEEERRILLAVDEFLADWSAHGIPLKSGRDWRYGRFLFVAVDEHAAGVSGCSIDALTRALRALESELDLSITDNGPVLFRDGDTIRRVPRPEFRKLADMGAVGEQTVVFDNTIQTVGALRDGRWEVPARQSWHGTAFLGGDRSSHGSAPARST